MRTTADQERPRELGSAGYEIFIAGVSVISIIGFIIEVLPVDSQAKLIGQVIDIPITLILLADFTSRLLRSHPRRDYFIKNRGYLDLLGCVPGLRIFRLFRLVRVVRLLRNYGGGQIVRELVDKRAENALYIVMLLVLVLLEFGSMSVLEAERSSPDANIKTGGEALWWAFVSITTVGYGDYTPVTPLGRFLGVLVLAAGVGLFGALSGFLANAFLSPTKRSSEAAAGGQNQDPMTMLATLEAGLAKQIEMIAAIKAAMLVAPQTLD